MTLPADQLATYAVADAASRGRVHPETVESDESVFDLDRQRILNCMAFRRLMHKTQVFVTDGGDHFRTRLTHTLEVVAQAVRLARLLRVNEALAAAIALAHDLGHSPFGHAGESALAELMKDHGSFEHNVQSLRVVDYLEHPYPAFRGLNLSFELRESLIKHNTKYDRPDRDKKRDEATQALLATGPNPPIEGQVANFADTVAFTLHDIEDGLVQGVLSDAVLDRSLIWRRSAAGVREAYPDRPIHALRRPIIDGIATRLAADAAEASQARIDAAGIRSTDEARQHDGELVGFSSAVQDGVDQLQSILFDSVYRNHRVVRMDAKARRLIRDLFDAYLDDPDLMPNRFADRIPEQGPHRVICDYVAGMTDRFCQREHQRLFAPFHFE
jgi:dGTPase